MPSNITAIFCNNKGVLCEYKKLKVVSLKIINFAADLTLDFLDNN